MIDRVNTTNSEEVRAPVGAHNDHRTGPEETLGRYRHMEIHLGLGTGLAYVDARSRLSRFKDACSSGTVSIIHQ